MSDLCSKIENDDFYKHFLSNNVKDKQELATSITFSEQINRLTDGLDELTNELQLQIRSKHNALLSQATHANKLNTALDSVTSNIEKIKINSDKIKSQINVPYNLLIQQTKILGRLHDASHLLRQTGRFLQLYKKLQANTDLIQQASVIYELEPLVEDEELNRIELITEEKKNILTIKKRLISLGHKELSNGLKMKKQQQIVKSLQIFSNLNILNKCLYDLLDIYINDIKNSLKECFNGTDVNNLIVKKQLNNNNNNNNSNSNNQLGNKVPGKTPSLTTSLNYRNKLWTAFEWFFTDELFILCNQILLLKKCLINIQLNINNNIENDDEIIKNIDKIYWNKFETLLIKTFNEANPHIKQCLEHDLPKLLSCIRNFEIKINHKQFLINDLTYNKLQVGYLEKCCLNLKTILTGIDIPTQETIDLFIRTTSNELSLAIIDEKLLLLITNIIITCNNELYNKIKNHVKYGIEIQQVVDIPNTGQLNNITFANLIYYHNECIKRMINNLGNKYKLTKSSSNLLENLKDGDSIILQIIKQLIDSMNSTVNIILLSLHREPGFNTANTTNVPSLYIKELNDFLQRSWIAHIQPFHDKDSVNQCGKELASNCIQMFVQNIAVVRPLTIHGRNKLKTDCLHLETSLKIIVNDLSTIGKSYRLLRAVSSLLTLTQEEIIEKSSEPGGAVPNHIILFFLFSYAGTELISPHIAAGWSNEKLMQWFANHTNEIERLELISGALQKYQNTIRQKNQTQYDPVYPLIASFLKKSYEYLQ